MESETVDNSVVSNLYDGESPSNKNNDKNSKKNDEDEDMDDG